MTSSDPAQPVMDVVLCWHMHQPDYRLGGIWQEPWTWLHAIKDYTDMAAHLESVPGARAVVNFSGVLIEQLQDYPRRIAAYLEQDDPVGDPILDALGGGPTLEGSRRVLIASLLRVNESRMKPRFEPYSRLFDQASAELAGGIRLTDREVNDLIVWYVLVWLGESLRSTPFVEKLATRERDYTADDRRNLLSFIGESIANILPRYRELAEAGVAELSLTPYAHPILPLLLDTQIARESITHAALPDVPFPSGRERCLWHLARARRIFAEAFGFEARGCWPSEGAVSDETLEILGDQGFRWTASGSKVLSNSLARAQVQVDPTAHLHTWVGPDADSVCFFRDDELSDLIGFEYSKWNGDEAVEHLIALMLRRRDEYFRETPDSTPVLSIIMDGENAWEYFPENGWTFLQALYSRLAAHPDFNVTTFSENVGHRKPRALDRLCAGSWVHGTLSTWIGDPAKNRAWELLSAAKMAVDTALAPFAESDSPEWAESILRQLAICEASDWFWWLGEDNRLRDSAQFDYLFRRQLESLYDMIGIVPPDVLTHPLVDLRDQVGEQSPASGAMRSSQPPG